MLVENIPAGDKQGRRAPYSLAENRCVGSCNSPATILAVLCYPRRGPANSLKNFTEKGLAVEAKRNVKFPIAVLATIAVLCAAAVYAQEKYALITPGGMAFADFRGYEDWAVVSSARTDKILKVIVASPAMINAYKSGVPGDGQVFPEGSRIVKLQWKPKLSTEAPFVVEVPDVLAQVFVMEKDSKRFPKTGGWGYGVFNYDAASKKYSADPSPVDCGNTCHVAVKSKDYIFHPYQTR